MRCMNLKVDFDTWSSCIAITCGATRFKYVRSQYFRCEAFADKLKADLLPSSSQTALEQIEPDSVMEDTTVLVDESATLHESPKTVTFDGRNDLERDGLSPPGLPALLMPDPLE
ncbi:hypothetical protein R1sor_008181 [Riccia sorocarpa]|uniref:Uncharacterized protein n=1 Tax=Riccia sorocarpa TaxID=122646 RepID=A0ABD3HSL2_9MARC